MPKLSAAEAAVQEAVQQIPPDAVESNESAWVEAKGNYEWQDQLRESVFETTKQAVAHGFLVREKYVKIGQEKIDAMKNGTTVVKQEMAVPLGKEFQDKSKKTVIDVRDEDTNGVCRRLFNSNLNPAAVVSAHRNRAGGGGLNSADSYQEAAIFRTTNVHQALFTGGEGANTHLEEQLPKKQYQVPVKGGIYVPHATVFREGENKGYAMCQPWELSFYFCAAYDLEDTIRNSLRALARSGHDAVVFPALGCGQNPKEAEVVASQFKKVLEDDEFRGVFKNISFAIPDPTTAYTFRNVFGE